MLEMLPRGHTRSTYQTRQAHTSQTGKWIRPNSSSRILTLAAISSLALLFVVNPYEKSVYERLLSLLVISIAFAPVVVWAKDKNSGTIPVLGMYGAMTGLCYGLAGFVTPTRYMSGIVVAEASYSPALGVTLLSIVCTILAYWVFKRVIQKQVLPFGKWGGQIERSSTILLLSVFFATLILKNVARPLGLGVFASIIDPSNDLFFVWLAYRTFEKGSWDTNWAVFLGLVLPSRLLFGIDLLNGFLFGLIVDGVLLTLCWIVARHSFPLPILVMTLLVGFQLNQGKGEYRNRIWERDKGGNQQSLSLFVDLATDRFAYSSRGGVWEKVSDTYSRFNHLQLVAAILEQRIPETRYWGVQSYMPITTKWVPRFFWPDKPVEDLGNRWPREFGWLDANDTSTSFNLPLISEMLLSGGIGAVVIVSGVLGWILYLIEKWCSGGSFTVSRFATGLTVAKPFLAPPERNFSMVVGEVIIACVVCWFLLGALRAFLRSGH